MHCTSDYSDTERKAFEWSQDYPVGTKVTWHFSPSGRRHVHTVTGAAYVRQINGYPFVLVHLDDGARGAFVDDLDKVGAPPRRVTTYPGY